MGKNPPDNAGNAGLIFVLKDLLEEEMATHSSILAWKIPWTEEAGGVQSMGSQSQARLSTITLILTHGSRPRMLLNIPKQRILPTLNNSPVQKQQQKSIVLKLRNSLKRLKPLSRGNEENLSFL